MPLQLGLMHSFRKWAIGCWDVSRFDIALLKELVQQKSAMEAKQTDDVRADAVRIAQASGLTRKQITSELDMVFRC